MKKLIICAVLATAAFAAQAASMKWASGGIGLPPSGSGTATGSAVTAKLFALDATAYGALGTAIAGKTADEISTYIYKNYKDAAGAITTGAWSKGAVTQTQTTGTFTTDDTAYAVVLYTATVDEKEYYIGNYGSWTFASDSNKTMSNMGTKLNGSGSALSWQAADVPEPTSGLLMLVGFGALALRRRRA